MKLFSIEQFGFWANLRKKHPNASVYLVGGAVRDALLDRSYKDIDFVVTNVEIEILQSYLETLGQVHLVGKRFGVLKFKPQNEKSTYDIALPRTESSRSFSGAYRDFDIQSDPSLPIETDLSRRDFTINAMAYDLFNQELIDPFLGQKDLESKTIRTVGSAVTRFQEDYSRMLRGIRFACQLDFSLSEKCLSTIQRMGQHLHDKIKGEWVVSRETLSQEFLKAFDAHPLRCLDLLTETKLLQIILPEVEELKTCDQSYPYHLEGSAYNHIQLAFKQTESGRYKQYFPKPISLMTKLGILFHDLGKPRCSIHGKKRRIHFPKHAEVGAKLTSEICNRLQLGSTEYYTFKPKHLAWMVKNHLFSIEQMNNEVSYTLLEELFFSDQYPSESLLQLMLADLMGSQTEEEIRSIEPFEQLWTLLDKMKVNGTLPAPLLTGEDVLETLTMKPGPEVKEYLIKVREAQLRGNISTKQQAIDYLNSL